MRSYQYRYKDYSLLKEPFTTAVVRPLLKLVPRSIPANFITIWSRLFLYGAVYLAFNQSWLGVFNFTVIPVLLLLFLIGDGLDGAHARQTGTASSLGEFCDHYLDSLTNGLLLLILFGVFEVQHPWIIAAVLYTSYLASTTTFYEQFKGGWFISEPLGAREMVFLGAVIILLANFPVVFSAYLDNFAYGLSLFEWFLIFVAIGSVITFMKTLNRTSHVTYGIWLFAAAFLIIIIFGALMFTLWQIVVVATLYASWYIGKLMTAHLVDGVERSTGLFTPIVMILAFFMHSLYPANTFIIVTAYMAINIALLIYRVFKALKDFWLWRNPS